MKLEWLAAVLRPRDIAPLRYAPDPDYDEQPHVRLAAAILGDPLRNQPIFEKTRPSTEPREPDSGLVKLAIGTFVDSTIRESTAELVERIEDKTLDIAVTCAVSLVAATALAEFEDLAACQELLTSVLQRIPPLGPAHSLLRACVLQQLSLRKRDWGDEDTSHSFEVTQILEALDVEAIESFPVHDDADSTSTIRHMIAALREAAWSMLKRGKTILDEDNAHAIDWEEITKTDSAEEFLLIDEFRANKYRDYIESVFLQEFGDRSIRFGSSFPDLFHVNLRNELYGTWHVRDSRKELAIFRLVLSTSDPAYVNSAECLRLLRYVSADDLLDLALNRIRYGGPLAGLSKDARQVIARRLTPETVRSSDLAVVRAAAELLTEPEVRVALDLVLELLDSGSPLNEAGRWTASFSRKEKTWRTAASLANALNGADRVLSRLLTDIRSTRYDEALDLAYMRVIYALDWPGESDEVTISWRAWLNDSGEWRHIQEAVRIKLEIPLAEESHSVTRLPDVDAVVNDLLSGHSVSTENVDKSAELLVDALSRIRTAARAGQFSAGGTEPSVLAVVLAAHGSYDLWQPLVEFFNDPVVPRRYKSPALDWMAGPNVRLPEEIAELFRTQWATLVWARDRMPVGGEPFGPYPSALRFLGHHHLLSESDLLLALSQLGGGSDVKLRIAAARTVAVLANSWTAPWMTGLALQLSHNSNPDIQAYAANALSIMATSSVGVGEAAVARLVSLLNSDGIIAPLLGIRGLAANKDSAFDPQLEGALQYLAADHPAKRVRAEAGELLLARHDNTQSG